MPLNNGHIGALCAVLNRCPLLGGLFVLKSSIRTCHVVQLMEGALYSDCPLMEVYYSRNYLPFPKASFTFFLLTSCCNWKSM